MSAIPWTVISPGMVHEARMMQGRQRLQRMQVEHIDHLPAEAVLYYADEIPEVAAQLAAACGEDPDRAWQIAESYNGITDPF